MRKISFKDKRFDARLLKYAPLFACLLVFIAFNASFAQDLASIVGTATDPTGAAVPGVKITISNEGTGAVARVLATNSAGDYAAPALPVGTYSAKAEAAGFSTLVRSPIILNVGAIVRVDFSLTVGAVRQEVEVTAPVVHLQTETGVETFAIAGQNVAEIDTNGRNFMQLASLVPGVTSFLPSFNTPVGVSASETLYFNGERYMHNVWNIDGAENYDRGCGGCLEVIPDQDAIQEFTVQSSNMGQEVGFGSGAQIQVAIKRGTDHFHGEAFEFNRNTVLDASTFFANASNIPKPTLNFNDFGFNIGGPLYLPGHAKKTFFFYEMDWRRLVQGSTIFAPGVPTAWTTGDLSSYNAPILDHTKPVTLPNGQTGYTPFSNNQIPPGMLDPNAVILAKPNFIFESPNTPDGKFFAGSPSVPTKVGEEVVSIDHQFSEKTSLMGHYIRDGVDQHIPTTMWSSDTYPTIGTDFLNEPQSFLLKVTRSINPTLLNEALVDFNRQPLTLYPTGTFTRPSNLGIQLLYSGTNVDNRIPTIGLDGPALGVNYDPYSWPWHNDLNTWTFRDELTKSAGKHLMRFGAEYMHYLKEQAPFGDTQGDFTFNGSATAGSYLGPSGQILTTSGNEFADFMLGKAFEFTEYESLPMPAFINNFYSVWWGDSYKARKGLTLNLGIRWEGMPRVYEKDNRVSTFFANLFDPSQAPQVNSQDQIVPGSGNLLNGIGIAGKNGIQRSLVDSHWANFEPRIGFAWQPSSSGKIALRGGYGIFYDNISGGDFYQTGGNPPFSHVPVIFNTSLTNPGMVAGAIFPGSLQSYDPRYLQPYSQQWSLGVEDQLSPGAIFSLMYVGSKGTHEQINININQPQQPAGSAVVDTVRPFRGWSNIGYYENATSSNYNSLQASLRTSNWHGLTTGISYTWSHCLDYGDNDWTGYIQNAYNVGSEYGNCGYDIRDTLVVNYVYSLPLGRNSTGPTRVALGGWQLAGISTFYTGIPLTVSFPGDPAQIGGAPYRANEVGNPNSGSGIHTAAEWFNTAAFAAVPTGSFGDSARNITYGEGINNWDISLYKRFTGIPFPGSKEGATLQFRAEFFNAFNHTQFNGYFTTYGTTGFGAPNGTRDPREIQLGLKFIF